jgi:ribosomal protein S18 acetylase RimI-like enzyme
MSIEIEIRPGRIKDKNRVERIWRELVNYHRKITTLDLEMVDEAPDIFMKYFEKHVRSRVRRAIVAEKKSDDKIIGYLLGELQRRPPLMKTKFRGFISDIAVTENMQGKGVGSKLLESFEAWAKEKKMKYVHLDVVPENDRALKLYDKHGFSTILLGKRKII